MTSDNNPPKKKKSPGKKCRNPRKTSFSRLSELSLSDEFNNLFTIAFIRTLNELRTGTMSEKDFLGRITALTEDIRNDFMPYKTQLASNGSDILIDKSDRKNWHFTADHEIPTCLSLAERIYLKAILQSRYCPIFFDEEEKARLLEHFADVPSIGLEKNSVFAQSDRHTRAFPPDEISKIRMLLSAVRNQKEIEYSNKARNGRIYEGAKGFPVRIEYSVFDDRFRLSLWSSEESRPVKINISSMYDISETGRHWDNPLTPQDMMKTKLSDVPIEMRLKGTDYRFERALYSFSIYNTIIERTGENEYFFRLQYYRFDLPEITDKIMSFGPAIQVLSPPEAIEMIRQHLSMNL